MGVVPNCVILYIIFQCFISCKRFSHTTECFTEIWPCCLCTLCFKCLHCIHCIKWCSTQGQNKHVQRCGFCYRVAECPRSKRVRFGNEAQRRLTSLTEYLEAPNPQTLSRVCWALLLAETKSRLWIVTLIFLSVCYFPANEGMLLSGYLCGTSSLEKCTSRKRLATAALPIITCNCKQQWRPVTGERMHTRCCI